MYIAKTDHPVNHIDRLRQQFHCAGKIPSARHSAAIRSRKSCARKSARTVSGSTRPWCAPVHRPDPVTRCCLPGCRWQSLEPARRRPPKPVQPKQWPLLQSPQANGSAFARTFVQAPGSKSGGTSCKALGPTRSIRQNLRCHHCLHARHSIESASVTTKPNPGQRAGFSDGSCRCAD